MSKDFKLTKPGEVRTRVAPSPTGPLHIGLARTTLFNYLFTKKKKGSLILRIDDTDKERSKEKWEKAIREGLHWLGLEWQEGPQEGGEHGPYRQSERTKIYKKYIKKLKEKGSVYPCFCSKEDLKKQREYQISRGKPPRYPGTCRKLSKEEAKEKIENGESYVLRLKTPSKKTEFKDILRGKIQYDTDDFGDIVVAKDEETPLYNLASVIDDYEMKISHVIRGEDHIANTHKQLIMAELLGIEELPQYLHLPLILSPTGGKLSKRDNVKSISEYKEEGYLPEAIINFLALLGWSPGNDKEVFSMNSLIKEFSLENIQKSGAAFNAKKLNWLNGFYIRSSSSEKITRKSIPYLIKAGFIEKLEEPKKFKVKETGEKISFKKIEEMIKLYQERLKKIFNIPKLVDFFFKEELEYEKEMLRWKEQSDKNLKKCLKKLRKKLKDVDEESWRREKLEEMLLEFSKQVGEGDRGKVLWPMRVALTSKKASAGPFEIAEVLGKKETIKRIKKARKTI